MTGRIFLFDDAGGDDGGRLMTYLYFRRIGRGKPKANGSNCPFRIDGASFLAAK